MQQTEQREKSFRILTIWEYLNQGKAVNKKQVAFELGVDEKTIQRDMGEIKNFLSDAYTGYEVEYRRQKNGYVLNTNSSKWFTDEEVLAITKILLESRAFSKEDVNALLNKSLSFCQPEKRKYIEEVIVNERFHYVAARHDQRLFRKLWEISCAIKEKNIIEIHYKKEYEEVPVIREIEPRGVVFSEYYFYVLGDIRGKTYEFPAIYRLDRIVDYRITNQRFIVSYADRFEEGEFRKRVQFMTTGKLMKIQFKFCGWSLQAVMDRLPTARIVEQREEGTIIEAEVFGKGIKMWLLSQAQYIEVLKPKAFRQEMKETIEQMRNAYT